MEITAYTTPTCSHCKTLIQLFERAGVEYTKFTVTRSPSVDPNSMLTDSFRKMYPDRTGFPFVIIDGKEIGGLVETARFFLEKGLVSAKK